MFIVFAFVLAAWPVWRLTRSGVAVPSAVAGTDHEAVSGEVSGAKHTPVDVEAVFAPAPADFHIQNLGKTVLTGQGPQARFTTRWMTVVPLEGVDLVVRARWTDAAAASGAAAAGTAPGANPAAARITVRFVDGRQVEKSFWAAANGALAEVFTVPGGAPAAVAP